MVIFIDEGKSAWSGVLDRPARRMPQFQVGNLLLVRKLSTIYCNATRNGPQSPITVQYDVRLYPPAFSSFVSIMWKVRAWRMKAGDNIEQKAVMDSHL